MKETIFLPFTDIFEDVTKYGTKIPTIQYLKQGKYPIIDQGKAYIAGYTNQESGLFCDVPIIIFGDHTRILKFVDMPFFLGADGVKVIKPKLQCNVKYLYYVLQTQHIPDTGYNRHFKWLKSAILPILDSSRQEEVVQQLEKIEHLITKRKQQMQKVDELVKSQFIEIFGDPRKNEKGWERVYLSDIAEYYNGLTYQPDDVDDNGIIVLRSSNIQGGELDFSDTVRVSCPLKSKLFVKDKDILMCSRNGSAKLVGKVALIKKPQEDMTFGAFMMIIRSAYPEYLLSYFNTPAFREEIRTGATTTINQITSSMLNKIKLPLPPKTMLGEFARFVEQTDKSKNVYDLGVAA